MSENEIKKNNSMEKQPLTDGDIAEKATVQGGSVAPAPKTEDDYFNDVEIFDIDAVRRAKQTEAQSKRNEIAPKDEKPLSKPPVFSEKELQLPDALGLTVEEKKSPLASKVNAPKKEEPKKTYSADEQPISKDVGVSAQELLKKDVRITDIKPEKVVFDSSVQQEYVPEVKSTKEQLKEKDKKGPSAAATLAKSLIYVSVVLVVSVLLAYFIIVVANDVFAFVKSDAQVEVNIPEYATIGEIADILHEGDVIKYPKIFVLYNKIRKRDTSNYLSGVYTVSPMQNYDELLSMFKAKKSNNLTEVSVTIPEGYTVDDIIKLLVEEKGIGTKEGFVDAIQNYDYEYWFIDEMKNPSPDRKYRLEGYLYPDTYYFYRESEEYVIINKMLQNFHSKFSAVYKEECEKMGMSVDEVINLASIIQMEAKYSTEYTTVSSVIHNRLKSKSTAFNKRLECDATIQYFLPERKEELTYEDTRIDNPYNSYLYPGLPPGPISNPTLKAIRAALYPEDTAYYYFVSMKNGHMLFAKTLPEHEYNKKIAFAD